MQTESRMCRTPRTGGSCSQHRRRFALPRYVDPVRPSLIGFAAPLPGISVVVLVLHAARFPV